MRNFTKKEMEVLAEYEQHLETAYKYGFKHYTSKIANDTVADIYAAAGGVFSRNWSCGHCLLALYKGAGKLYYETKEKMEKAEAKKAAREAKKLEEQAEKIEEKPVEE